MTIAVVSCVYGDYGRFIPAWVEAVRSLNTRPDEIIIASDRDFGIPGVTVIVSDCPWKYPQPYYLEEAITATDADWVWKLDIDDTALPDALDGIDDVFADVWQMGYHYPDGSVHLPPQLTGAEFLALDGNPFVSSSAFTQEAYWAPGGYPDIAFEDWGLWRRMAHAGMTFQSSGRPHFVYAEGPYTRGANELRHELRPVHLQEMLEACG